MTEELSMSMFKSKDDFIAELQSKLSAAEEEIERLKQALHDIYEVYAGMDGFIRETCPEGYQNMIIQQMADIARDNK